MSLTMSVIAFVFTQRKRRGIKKSALDLVFATGFSENFRMFSQLSGRAGQIFTLGEHGVFAVSHFMMVVTTKAGSVHVPVNLLMFNTVHRAFNTPSSKSATHFTQLLQLGEVTRGYSWRGGLFCHKRKHYLCSNPSAISN